MDKKVSALINDQINKEFYSAYLYLDMANYYDANGLDGFANWYEIQAKEEEDHAMLFYKYLKDNGEDVTLEAIAKPDKVYGSITDPLEAGLSHEKYVTSLINDIYTAAKDTDDYRTMNFLNWFIDEQEEEEKNASDQLTKMKLYGGDPGSLYMMNEELLKRKYSAPKTDE